MGFWIDPQQQTRTILNFIINEGKKNIGFLLPDNAYGYLLRDTIEKVLAKNNLTPSRVEFFKDNIDSQRIAAKKISRGFEEYEKNLKEIEEENLENNKSEKFKENKEALKKPLDSVFKEHQDKLLLQS